MELKQEKIWKTCIPLEGGWHIIRLETRWDGMSERHYVRFKNNSMHESEDFYVLLVREEHAFIYFCEWVEEKIYHNTKAIAKCRNFKKLPSLLKWTLGELSNH